MPWYCIGNVIERVNSIVSDTVSISSTSDLTVTKQSIKAARLKWILPPVHWSTLIFESRVESLGILPLPHTKPTLGISTNQKTSCGA